MEKKQLLILTVYRISKNFERFVIQDEKQQVWTGEEFHSSGAALYANHNQACTEVHKILKRNFIGIEPKRYVVPCFIEVFSHEPIQEIEVAKFISKASKLTLDTGLNGNGPSNSLVLPVIDWRRIEELPND